MMDVTISGFYDEAADDLDGQIAECLKLGEHFICPRNMDGKSIADFTVEEFERNIKPRLDKAGISFSSIGSPIGKIAWDDDAAFEKQLGQLTALVQIAQRMGCSYIRVFAFYVSDELKEKAYPTIVRKFQKFLQIAHGSGVKLLLENEKKVFGSLPEEMLRLFTDMNTPDLALCFDASNFIQCKVDPLVAFHQLKQHISYLHIKDCSRWGVEVPFGVGEAHYPEIFAELNAMNYHGFMTLEPHLFRYALNKRRVYFVPFAAVMEKDLFKSFRLIDRAMKRSYFQMASRPEVFEWQHALVVAALKKEGVR